MTTSGTPTCVPPALTYRCTAHEGGKSIRSYWTSSCPSCVIRDKCTTGKERRVRRWEHEDVLDRVQKRLDDDPSKLACAA